MASAHQTQPSWGTWEDLLLACAVKRHGLHNWDSVSTELRTKTSLLTTAQICHQKYQDLKRRFATTTPAPDEIPWLEDLRRVRVAELKRDLQRYDVSILALQLKVKKLEEEREQRRRLPPTQQDGEDKPDLDPSSDFMHDGSQNEKSPAQIPEENRSVNGSNSTGSERRENEKADPDPVGLLGSEDEEASSGSEEEELSSDMQSSASLERKRRRRWCGGGGGGDDMKGKSEASDGLLEKIRAHSESGLFAQGLQSQEGCKDYKALIRQHVDLETIQARMMIPGGAYSPSSLAFYRDLLLLFTNYIVFFPKLSHQSRTAHQLRDLVLDHINNHTNKSDSSHDPDHHLPPLPSPKPDLETPHSNTQQQQQLATTTQKSSPPPPPPFIVCRKRSSVSPKPSSNPGIQPHTQSDDNDINNNPPAATSAAVDAEASLLEKPITGTRSSRRSSSASAIASNNRKPPASANTSNDTTPDRKPNGNKTEKQGITTTNKKIPQVSASDKKKSVADFLKRIKKNSPEVTKKISKGAEQKKNNAATSSNNVKERGKEKVARRSLERKQRQGKEDTSPSKRSVGRPPKRDTDRGGKEKEANPPKKRARR